jgi:hypothetical protein
MHPDRDFDPEQPLPPHEPTLMQDLALDTLLRAMAGEDGFLRNVAHRALLGAMANDVETVLYRQEVLRDCIANPQAVHRLYDLTVDTIERKRKSYFGFLIHYPSSILRGSVELMEIFVEQLRKLRDEARALADRFSSRGFTALFETLQRELSDDYLATVSAQLKELKFDHGVLMSAQLGPGNKGIGYGLRLLPDKRPYWVRRLIAHAPHEFTFRLPERDEAGGRFLSELQDRGLNTTANALGQASEQVLSFFVTLRTELAFCVACLNLHDQLRALDAPVCFARPLPAGARGRRFTELYDPCLALAMGRRPVGNTVEALRKSLMIVTGANQGGKSSFLRSLGIAQLMMQCGLFVAAEEFAGGLCTDLFTHYKREEDATMRSGKFDEELTRMNEIAEQVRPEALVLFNESFAATNEREGSEVARQIVDALLERHIEVAFVTHLYDFSHGVMAAGRADAIFLRAERLPDGSRPFRLVEGAPLATSYGKDLYREVFETAREA